MCWFIFISLYSWSCSSSCATANSCWINHGCISWCRNISLPRLHNKVRAVKVMTGNTAFPDCDLVNYKNIFSGLWVPAAQQSSSHTLPQSLGPRPPGDLGLIESHCRGSTLISKGRSKLSGGKRVQFSPLLLDPKKFQWEERIFEDLQTGIGEIRGLGLWVRDTKAKLLGVATFRGHRLGTATSK